MLVLFVGQILSSYISHIFADAPLDYISTLVLVNTRKSIYRHGRNEHNPTNKSQNEAIAIPGCIFGVPEQWSTNGTNGVASEK